MVTEVKFVKVCVFDIFAESIVSVADLVGRDNLDKRGSQFWSQLVLMSLIVDESSLDLRVFVIRELSPDSSISESDGKGSTLDHSRATSQDNSDEHHDRVKYSDVTSQFEFTILVNMGVSHEHVSSWNPHVSKDHPSVVL